MNKASKSITLTLIGSATALLSYGYFGCRDDNQSAASTQPSRSGGPYHSWYHPAFWGGGSRGSSGSSTAHGFTSRGGFGASGHAAGS